MTTVQDDSGDGRVAPRWRGRAGGWGRGALAALLVVSGVAARTPLGGAHAGRAARAAVVGAWMWTAPMSLGRGFATATLLPSGQVLVAGGNSNLGDLSSAELYTAATGTWSSTRTLMTTPREQHTATLLRDGQVLLTGGVDQYSGLGSAELYNPATGTFTPTVTGLGVNVVDQSAARLRDGRVLVAGGCSGTFAACVLTYAAAEVYDPATDTFTPTGSMTTPRQYQTATLLPSGKVLIAGGATCDACYPLASAELYDPATGTFTPTGSMSSIRAFQTATLLPSGKVLIAGGCTNISGTCYPAQRALASAELYDPATGTFTPTGSMTTARYSHSATLLPTGQVLIAAGANGQHFGGIGYPVASAELYDVPSGTFTTTASLHQARAAAAVAPLPTGQVLVAGGCPIVSAGCNFPVLSSAEVYTPLTLTVSLTAGVSGQPLAVTGRAFSPGETVALSWDSPLARPRALVTADGTGAISATVRLPLTWRGRHTLIARGQTSTTAAYAFVWVWP